MYNGDFFDKWENVFIDDDTIIALEIGGCGYNIYVSIADHVLPCFFNLFIYKLGIIGSEWDYYIKHY